MSLLRYRRIPVIGLMAAVVCLYAFSGIVLRSHPVLGLSSNGRIAFSGMDSQSDMQIFTMNADGSHVQQLTNASFALSPVWSPDGTKIAYMSTDFGDQTDQIFVMNADGTNQVDITNDDNTQNDAPSWSPDGSKIAYMSQPADFSADPTINVIDADGSNTMTLTDPSKENVFPAWSPDSSQLAYSCFDTQNVEQVCTMNPDGSNQQQITSGTAISYISVGYSPSGTQFVYATYNTTNNDIINVQELGVMNTDGSNAHILNTADHTSVADVSWSPDGTKLLYDSFDSSQSNQRIYYINTDGTNETAVSPDNQIAQTPAWQPIPAADMDGDGVLNSTEAAAPNNGDANGDGIADRLQAKVTSIVDPVTGKYASIQSNCISNTAVSAQTLPITYVDPAFHYPAGLLSFTLDCGSAGTTATVTQYFYGVTASDIMVLRKYNSQTHVYTTIPGTTVTAATIGGQTVTKVTYQVKDGGAFDEDGSANGTIVDPVGLAVPSVGTPNTGIGGLASLPRILAAPLL